MNQLFCHPETIAIKRTRQRADCSNLQQRVKKAAAFTVPQPLKRQPGLLYISGLFCHIEQRNDNLICSHLCLAFHDILNLGPLRIRNGRRIDDHIHLILGNADNRV